MKWIHIPHNAVLVFDIVIIYFAISIWYQVKQAQPPADEVIRVIGQQWSWRFIHPGLDKILDTQDDVETVDELHVKVDTTYHFQLSSIDVLHSFSIPAFRLKQDAIPGRVITGWFKPTVIGKYDFQCAEICGIGHGIMQSQVIVETAADHEKWLKSQPQVVAAAPVVAPEPAPAPAPVMAPEPVPAPAPVAPATAPVVAPVVTAPVVVAPSSVVPN